MEAQLLQLGLNEQQATLYLYLLRSGAPQKPSTLASKLGISRTNVYKILDSLTELNLVQRVTDKATLSYTAEDPSALAGLASRARNEAIRLEKLTKELMPKLKDAYSAKRDNRTVSSKLGVSAIFNAHLQHVKQNQPNYFILSNRHDISLLGFDNMNKIRHAFVERQLDRYGITPDTAGAPKNPAIDKRTNLHRTWIDQSEYTAPVEWSVSGDELLIFDYSGEGSVVRIENSHIAEAFRQVWKLTAKALRNDPEYASMPKHAQREI